MRREKCCGFRAGEGQVLRADFQQPALYAPARQWQLGVTPADDDYLDGWRQVVDELAQWLATLRGAMVGVVVVEDHGDGRPSTRDGFNEGSSDAGGHFARRGNGRQEVVSWQRGID